MGATVSNYCTQADIENVFGVSNVAEWSNLDNDEDSTTANTARIAAAIAWASQYLDERLGYKYYIPLTGTSVGTTVKDWCAKLAGVWLYEVRGQRDATEAEENGNTVRLHKGIVNNEIDEALAGIRRMGLVYANSRESEAPHVVMA